MCNLLALGIIGELETDSSISFLAYDLINDPFLGFSSVTASRKSAGVSPDFTIESSNYESPIVSNLKSYHERLPIHLNSCEPVKSFSVSTLLRRIRFRWFQKTLPR